MRSLLTLSLLLTALGGCPQRDAEELSNGDASDGGDDGGDPDAGSAPPRAACSIDNDCRPAAATCCDCPTFAVHQDDPLFLACEDVDCPVGDQCSATSAVCEEGTCVLACDPTTCEMAYSDGFAFDEAGCLTCAPAAIGADCTADEQCVQTRADCCGCAAGGEDTAVPANQVGGFDGMLGCEDNVSCPGVDTCDPAAEPRCVQGSCALLSGGIPAGACGRADLPPCPGDTVCTLNLDRDATALGLGVCAPR